MPCAPAKPLDSRSRYPELPQGCWNDDMVYAVLDSSQ